MPKSNTISSFVKKNIHIQFDWIHKNPSLPVPDFNSNPSNVQYSCTFDIIVDLNSGHDNLGSIHIFFGVS